METAAFSICVLYEEDIGITWNPVHCGVAGAVVIGDVVSVRLASNSPFSSTP